MKIEQAKPDINRNDIHDITLTLSKNEAAVLFAVMGSVAGGGTVRTITSKFYSAIQRQYNLPSGNVKNLIREGKLYTREGCLEPFKEISSVDF